MDKVRSVSENGAVTASFTYDVDGQIATAKTHATGKQESFLWDGLALIHRGGTSYINEPYVTGGNPILAEGTTLGVHSEKYESIARDAFGMTSKDADSAENFFTGKPLVGELGYAFLFRNYRPEQSKWQTADPLGYPDGWNNFAYVKNQVSYCIDWLGCVTQELFVASGNPYIKLENRNPSTHIHNEKNCNTYEIWNALFQDGTMYVYEESRNTWGDIVDWLKDATHAATIAMLSVQIYALYVPGFTEDVFILPFTLTSATIDEVLTVLQDKTGNSMYLKSSSFYSKQLTEWTYVKTVHSVAE